MMMATVLVRGVHALDADPLLHQLDEALGVPDLGGAALEDAGDAVVDDEVGVGLKGVGVQQRNAGITVDLVLGRRRRGVAGERRGHLFLRHQSLCGLDEVLRRLIGDVGGDQLELAACDAACRR